MGELSIRLPESLHKCAHELARKEGISINQLVTVALAEKLAALSAEDYLASRAKRASRSKFKKAMAKIPRVAPSQYDRLK